MEQLCLLSAAELSLERRAFLASASRQVPALALRAVRAIERHSGRVIREGLVAPVGRASHALRGRSGRRTRVNILLLPDLQGPEQGRSLIVSERRQK